MKKIIMLLLMALALCPAAFAQHKAKPGRAAMHRELREFKLKFLAQEMELRDDQKARFTDLYTQMSDEKEKVFKETRALEKKLADSKDASDAEYEAVSNAITSAKEKDAAIEKKYDAKFAEFLSKKQIFKMKTAEDQFRRKMHQMRHGKNGKNGRNGNKGNK